MKRIASNKSIRLSKEDSPTAVIDLEETVVVETINAFGDRFSDQAELFKLLTSKQAHHHPMTGPIYVNGVEKGDVLRVDIHSIVPQEMAQMLSKSAGIDPLQEPSYGDRSTILPKANTKFGRVTGIEYMASVVLDYEPMVGIIGTAPKEGYTKTGHAGTTGGNLDLPFVSEKTSVYLPVEVDGAFLYLGDCHAAQAYGELGGIALESSADITIKVSKHSMSEAWNNYENIPPVIISGMEPLSNQEGVGIVGVSTEFDNLNEAVRNSYQGSVAFIQQICPKVGEGGARNLVTLLGNSLNGQAGSKTAESTAMTFFKTSNLAKIFGATDNVLYEVMETVFPSYRE